jgi:hypothetical protein
MRRSRRVISVGRMSVAFIGLYHLAGQPAQGWQRSRRPNSNWRLPPKVIKDIHSASRMGSGAYRLVCGHSKYMTTTRVTVTIDAGVLADAQAVAAEHGMSVSAWISQCTKRETMRDALRRHRDWCATAGLAGDSYEQYRAQLIADAGAELDRLGEARWSGASDAG